MLFLWPSPSWAPFSREHTSKFLLCSVRPSSISVPLPTCLSFPLTHSTSAAVVSSLFLECAPAVGPWICCYVFLEHSFPYICTACSFASFKFSLKYHLLNETFPDYLIEYFLAITQILSPHAHFSSSCPSLFFSTVQYHRLLDHILCLRKTCVVLVAFIPSYNPARGLHKAMHSVCAAHCISLISGTDTW